MADLSRNGGDPTMNTKNTRGNTRETLKPTRTSHTYARSSKHKEIQDPRSTRDDTKGNRFFSVRRSWGISRDLLREGGLESVWIFSEEVPQSISRR